MESLASCGAGPCGELVELSPVPAGQAELLSALRAEPLVKDELFDSTPPSPLLYAMGKMIPGTFVLL